MFEWNGRHTHTHTLTQRDRDSQREREIVVGGRGADISVDLVVKRCSILSMLGYSWRCGFCSPTVVDY
jgi:hypothetical protein